MSAPVTDKDIIEEVQRHWNDAVTEDEEEDEEGEAVLSWAEMHNAMRILKTGLVHVGFTNFDLLHCFTNEARVSGQNGGPGIIGHVFGISYSGLFFNRLRATTLDMRPVSTAGTSG